LHEALGRQPSKLGRWLRNRTDARAHIGGPFGIVYANQTDIFTEAPAETGNSSHNPQGHYGIIGNEGWNGESCLRPRTCPSQCVQQRIALFYMAFYTGTRCHGIVFRDKRLESIKALDTRTYIG
jgi:hypothetical protein